MLCLSVARVTPCTGAALQDVASVSDYGGLPKAQRFALRTWTRLLENDGFTIGYSELRRNPLWVSYHAAIATRRRHYSRPDAFRSDTRTWTQVGSRDYSRSGYQRGHMAPSWLIAQLYGRHAQEQTFLMSNITPQKPALNQKLWQRLEEIEADFFARWFNGVWVFTGPVFDADIQQLRSGIEIPDAFYRIFLDRNSEGMRALAFIVPQDVNGNEPLDDFLVTVDEIEARTGFDFMPDLDDVVEADLESRSADAGYWRLTDVSRLPARY